MNDETFQRQRFPILACHECGLIHRMRALPDGASARCRRCGATLYRDRRDGLDHALLLTLAALILFVLAHSFPFMTFKLEGREQVSTLLTGDIQLYRDGMWPLALLVLFTASLAPLLKLIGLTFLLVSVRRRSAWRPRDRTFLYRIIESVGRWSMVDIFMISILVALVNLGSIAIIQPGAGAIAFAAVVITTMIASMSFDPRLIWDRQETSHVRQPAAGK